MSPLDVECDLHIPPLSYPLGVVTGSINTDYVKRRGGNSIRGAEVVELLLDVRITVGVNDRYRLARPGVSGFA